METYGQKVQRMRTERGWTQDELADRAGLAKRTLQDVEADKRKNPQRATRLALSKVLEIESDQSVDELFADFSDDVIPMLLIVGAYLETMGPAERLAWFQPIARSATRGDNT